MKHKKIYVVVVASRNPQAMWWIALKSSRLPFQVPCTAQEVCSTLKVVDAIWSIRWSYVCFLRHGGTPIAGWFISSKNHLEMDDTSNWGYPHDHMGLRQNSGMDRPAVIQTYGTVWITCVLVWIGGMDRPVGSGCGSGLYILTHSHICIYIYIHIHFENHTPTFPDLEPRHPAALQSSLCFPLPGSNESIGCKPGI